jgi:hypothetical protein
LLFAGFVHFYRLQVQGFLRVYDDFYVLFYHVFAFKPRVGAGLAIVQQGPI